VYGSLVGTIKDGDENGYQQEQNEHKGGNDGWSAIAGFPVSHRGSSKEILHGKMILSQ
jgi:hypothetical protein